MKRRLLPALLLASAGILSAETNFYQDQHALFSTRPPADRPVTKVTRVGPIGISLDLLQPAFTMRISGIEPRSPAAATGQLETGMFIESINGQSLAGIDPRIQLGNWITEAEATDGRMVLQVGEKPGNATREVVVQLPVLGRYSDTWPVDCPKSDRIVRNFADFLKSEGNTKGFADIGMLFLLSTGNDSDLAHVRKWARAHEGASTYPWHIGYGGLALCEYYLRTGDREVLPAIQRMVDQLVTMENFGGWAGRGGTAHLGYGGGGGHLNAAGTLCLGYLMLARECGADVPEDTLRRVLARFYRYSGRGNVPYGQGLPEKGFVDNGKNGKLAFSMAAAAALDPRGADSLYARARDTSALFSFYSTAYMLHGHTGGGIGEIWRSAAMGLLHDVMPGHYRQFMDQRRWHYEMSRRHDGSFAILGGKRYDNTSWGAGYALTYTVPRKTLRLTGAPPTRFSKLHDLPERPWGTSEDDDFQSIEPANPIDASTPRLADESLSEHGGLAINRRLGSGDADAATVLHFIHHPSYVVRLTAARSIQRHGTSMLMPLLGHDDARVRRAAIEGILAAPGKLLERNVFDHLIGVICDPDESWFVKQAAIEAIGKASPDWIADRSDDLIPYLSHEEWWLQRTALEALAPVVAEERCHRPVLTAIGQLLRTNYRYNILGPMRWGPLPDNLRQADPKIQQFARQTLKESYLQFIEYDHPSDRIADIVNPTNLEALADSLVKVPGGYDTLYEIGRQEYPDQALPFREIFLKADPQRLSPELRDIVDHAVGGNLIPAYVAKHRDTLLKEAASAGVDRGGRMEGLVRLYQKVGVHDYDWRDHGPDHDTMEWSYHSFDPKEKWLEESDRLGRYREVTFPRGMRDWFAETFDPRANGWQRGRAPLGAADGEKALIAGNGGCELDFCKCADQINTLWEKDVLLMRGTFDFPTFEEGYRYRLLHGGISHVGSGGGYRIYVNGRLFHEDTTGVDRRGGARPEGRVIPREWWPEFEGGQATIAAITFKKHHPRTKKYGGNISIFMQRMKTPPIELE